MKEASWDQIQHLINNLAEKKASVVQWLTENWDLIKILMSTPDAKKIDRNKLKKFLVDCTQSADKLLETITTITILAIGTFKAKDHFKVSTAKGVTIGWIGDNFEKAFLNGKGKIEKNVAEAVFRIFKLVKGSVDTPIIAELGGEEVAETTLAQVFTLLQLQGKGQDGVLLTNGWANIFYVRDDEGTLWAVDCGWRSDCRYWSVEAYSVASPYGWDAGSQVISR